MKNRDREFLNTVIGERIEQLYEEHMDELRPHKDELMRLEKGYWSALDKLSEDDSEAVQAFTEHTFHQSANVEKVMYRLGVIDGIRLKNAMNAIENL